jgi:hypothetical protein
MVTNPGGNIYVSSDPNNDKEVLTSYWYSKTYDKYIMDTHVSHFGGKNCIARVPRMCLCGKADLDNPLHRCLWIRMAYQRALNEMVAQLSVPPETHPGKPPESHHQRRAWEKEMKEYMAALDAMSAHHCDNAFFHMKFGHNPFGIMLATPSDMMYLFESSIVKCVCQMFVDSMSTNVRV